MAPIGDIPPPCPAATSSGAVAVTESDWILGLGASALSGLSSAYAGVYFEKYVKGKLSGTLWVRNLQLGIYGLPLSIAYMLVKDWRSLQIGGIMQVSHYSAAGPTRGTKNRNVSGCWRQSPVGRRRATEEGLVSAGCRWYGVGQGRPVWCDRPALSVPGRILCAGRERHGRPLLFCICCKSCQPTLPALAAVSRHVQSCSRPVRRAIPGAPTVLNIASQ